MISIPMWSFGAAVSSSASSDTSGTVHPDLEMQAPPPSQPRPPEIERYANGYPRFAALLSAADSFLIARRFKRIRARILLRKQARISALERQLDETDGNEKCCLWLGTCEHDGNVQRRRILDEMEERLADYDKFVDDTNKSLSYEGAKPRDVQSLQNWLSKDGWIAEGDRTYLDHRDLFHVAPPVDNAMVSFESWVEDRLIQMPWYRKHHGNDVSNDRHVHIYSGMLIKRLSIGLMISLITLLLLLPIVVCNIVTTTALRIFVVMLSTVFYLLVLSGLTRARTTELVVAATTYATVLIVFVSGTD